MPGEKTPERPQERDRRKLDAIFGEVLPETTADERDPETGNHDRESWYRENRPPHHDR